MRIWDIHPGYLNRGSLLGEHRELHGIFNIIALNKSGYANHPETKRWRGHLGALFRRHQLLVAEMTLRGYQHHSPLPKKTRPDAWPQEFIDPPGEQFHLLSVKYRDTEPGRIPLPINCQALWAAHKYSVLARDQALYRKLGRTVAAYPPTILLNELAQILVETLRNRPPQSGVRNALEHMWGYVRTTGYLTAAMRRNNTKFLGAIVERNAVEQNEDIRISTALSDLAGW